MHPDQGRQRAEGPQVFHCIAPQVQPPQSVQTRQCPYGLDGVAGETKVPQGKPLNTWDLSGSNSTLLGGSRESLQAFQPTEGVGVGSPVCGTRIRVQKRFGLSHGLASCFQVHFGIDAGRGDVGVAQPAPDRDHVDTRLQEMGSGGVPLIPISELSAYESNAAVCEEESEEESHEDYACMDTADDAGDDAIATATRRASAGRSGG